MSQVVSQIADHLVHALENLTEELARKKVLDILEQSNLGSASSPVRRKLKGSEKQKCPVPNCTKTAAPHFNMVCAEHKDVPARRIEQYRKARRVAKEVDLPVQTVLADWDHYRRRLYSKTS